MAAKRKTKFTAAQAAKASAETAVKAQAKAAKAAAAQATADKAAAAYAAAANEAARMKAGDAVTVTATPYAPGYLARLGAPQIRLGRKINAVAIQPTGEPQTVYVAELVGGTWRHRAKHGVPANSPCVVRIPCGVLAFSRRGGGDIALVARAV